MSSDVVSDAPLANRPLTRMVVGALVGAVGGLLIGYLASSLTCNFADLYNCYPAEELKVGLFTAVGLFAGLLVSRLWPSMTSRQRVVVTTATLILIAVLAVSSYNRFHRWSCSDSGFCQVGDAVAST